MQKEISIIIMLSAFSVSAMAGGEVRPGQDNVQDNEYEVWVKHGNHEEGLQLKKNEYTPHPILNQRSVMP